MALINHLFHQFAHTEKHMVKFYKYTMVNSNLEPFEKFWSKPMFYY